MKFVTIFTYKERGELLGVSWSGEYFRTGCPYVEACRWLAYVLRFGRTAAISDLFAYVCFIPLFLAYTLLPFVILRRHSGFFASIWWFIKSGLVALAGHGLNEVLFYGPLNGTGELLHGDPFALGGKLYDDGTHTKPAKPPKPASKLDAVVGAVAVAGAAVGVVSQPPAKRIAKLQAKIASLQGKPKKAARLAELQQQLAALKGGQPG